MDEVNYRICYGYYTWHPNGHSGEFILDGAVKGKANAVVQEHVEERVSENLGRRVCIAYDDWGQVGLSICNPCDTFRKKKAKGDAINRLRGLDNVANRQNVIVNKNGFPVGMDINLGFVPNEFRFNGKPELVKQLKVLVRIWDPIKAYVQQQLEAANVGKSD